MQGASREALAQASAGVERALAASALDAARLSDELFAVVGMLDEQVALRRALSDPAIDADRKAALIESVLGSHVSAGTLDVVRDVVRSRWSRMRDLADGVEQLAVLARLVGADRDGHEDRPLTAHGDLDAAPADPQLARQLDRDVDRIDIELCEARRDIHLRDVGIRRQCRRELGTNDVVERRGRCSARHRDKQRERELHRS